LPPERLRAEREQLEVWQKVDLETAERIALVAEPAARRDAELPAGFDRFVQKVPQWVMNTPQGAIEIQFKQKQRAVGYQPMVYLCLPFAQWLTTGGDPRAPGHAHPKETVIYRFSRAQTDFLLATIHAFGIASREHNEDLTKILDGLLAK
jgi:R.Pab1 restriction endonuclease